MLIKDVKQWVGNADSLIGKKANWRSFYEVTGKPYGWILGTFTTHDDLWGMPIKVGMNNWYVTGTVESALYNILDLQASNAIIDKIDKIIVPIFERKWKPLMHKFETLTKIKLHKQYKSEVEKFAIKNTTNSTSGILGKSHPHFGDTTNIPAYNMLLAQSHLYMSEIFHKYHTKQHPIVYTDTDSYFWHKPVNEVIRNCVPYPTLPYQSFENLPLEVGVRGESCKDGTIIFRGKMYYQNPTSIAFSGWKPFPRYFFKVLQTRPKINYPITIERQVSRKWKTRDKSVATLKIGRWHVKEERWKLSKLRSIFRADGKRKRESPHIIMTTGKHKVKRGDSYTLFLTNQKRSSRAWTIGESFDQLATMPWFADLAAETMDERLSEILKSYGKKYGRFGVLS